MIITFRVEGCDREKVWETIDLYLKNDNYALMSSEEEFEWNVHTEHQHEKFYCYYNNPLYREGNTIPIDIPIPCDESLISIIEHLESVYTVVKINDTNYDIRKMESV
jgi:hypothetical protein